jgi:hypothetical protein
VRPVRICLYPDATLVIFLKRRTLFLSVIPSIRVTSSVFKH